MRNVLVYFQCQPACLDDVNIALVLKRSKGDDISLLINDTYFTPSLSTLCV